MSDVNAALKATTTLVNAGKDDSVISEWTKVAVTKIKTANTNEKNELQRLNFQLQKYLDDVKVLEGLNSKLIAEVDNAKAKSVPKLMDKTQVDKELEAIRSELETKSNECVKYEINLEEKQTEIQHINQRLKFLQGEADVNKNKIFTLQGQLNDIQIQKEHLVRSSHLAEDDIKREQEKAFRAEDDLAKLRKALSDSRSYNKKIEFEMQTILDQLAFIKAVHQEELTELRTRATSGPISNLDLNNFYKTELVNAVRQIRQDFHTLSDQQIKDYKEYKESELSVTLHQIEQDKVIAQQQKSRLDASKDLDNASAKELETSLTQNKSEMSQLNARQNELLHKLTNLENRLEELRMRTADTLDRKQYEIDQLKQQNGSYLDELDYWGRVTRTKLESEIQTYRSILNCQVKLMQGSTNTSSILTFQSSTNIPNKNQSGTGGNANNNTSASSTIISGATNTNNKSTSGGATSTSSASGAIITGAVTTDSNKVSTTKVTSVPQNKNEAIDILRQVFNYIDTDKSGKIKSSELDTVLTRLNIKLTSDAYNQICREADKDSSRDLDFTEFCNIMLPVFTGSFDDDELLFAFKKFDLDNSGHITVSELRQILSKIGQHFTEKEIADMIATVDANKDGSLSYQEFVRLMKSPSLKKN